MRARASRTLGSRPPSTPTSPRRSEGRRPGRPPHGGSRRRLGEAQPGAHDAAAIGQVAKALNERHAAAKEAERASVALFSLSFVTSRWSRAPTPRSCNRTGCPFSCRASNRGGCLSSEGAPFKWVDAEGALESGQGDIKIGRSIRSQRIGVDTCASSASGVRAARPRSSGPRLDRGDRGCRQQASAEATGIV